MQLAAKLFKAGPADNQTLYIIGLGFMYQGHNVSVEIAQNGLSLNGAACRHLLRNPTCQPVLRHTNMYFYASLLATRRMTCLGCNRLRLSEVLTLRQ